MPAGDGPAFDAAFVRRTAIQVLLLAAAFLVWRLSAVLLLAFGSIVVAVLLRSVSGPIRRHTPLGDRAAVAAAGVIILGAIVLAGWLFGSLVSQQATDLLARMPHSLEALKGLLRSWPFGEQLAAAVDGMSDGANGWRSAAGRFGAYAASAAGALAKTVLVILAGVFLALDPGAARDGFVTLFPRGARGRLRAALDATGRSLKLWAAGMLLDMAAVGVLTGLGAWAVGLPSPLALGLLAAIMGFVPIVGPIVAAIPGLVVAAPLGFETMAWTALVYVGVQQLEGNLIYPLIQRRAVQLPPALSLLAIVAFGVLFGTLGVVLATPLLVAAFVLTKLLYLRDALGEEVSVPGSNGDAKGADAGRDQ